MFEAGYSTADEGTGFGLDIVREIVESHGWTITLSPTANDPVDSAAGSTFDGARFVVEAPAPDAVGAAEPWIDR